MRNDTAFTAVVIGSPSSTVRSPGVIPSSDTCDSVLRGDRRVPDGESDGQGFPSTSRTTVEPDTALPTQLAQPVTPP